MDELPVNFDCSRTSLDLLNDSQEASKVRISLLKFFQDRNIPLSALRTIYKMVFEFFSRQVIEKNVPRIILREP